MYEQNVYVGPRIILVETMISVIFYPHIVFQVSELACIWFLHRVVPCQHYLTE